MTRISVSTPAVQAVIFLLCQHANAFFVNNNNQWCHHQRPLSLQMPTRNNHQQKCSVHNDLTRRNSQQNDSISSDNKKDKWLQSGYDTIDGYERFLYSKKQRKKNKQKDISFRRKINANNDIYREQYYMSNSFVYDDDNSDSDSIERENTAVIGKMKINGSKSKKYRHDEDEDGYRDMMKKKKERPFIKRLFMAPFQIGVKVTKKLMNKVPEPGTLILVRHGESEWNANKTFTVSIV